MSTSTKPTSERPPISRAPSLFDKLPDERPSDSTLEDPDNLRRAEEQASMELSRAMKDRQDDPDVQGQELEEEEVDLNGLGMQEQAELGHMQLVLPEGLWIGDVYAAQDEKSLQEAGITAVLSLITPVMTTVPSSVKHLSIVIEDSSNTDILSHLDQCVEWIDNILRTERDLHSDQAAITTATTPGVMEGEKQVEGDKVVRKGGVLVHCQAGMSRSATITAAYLMKVLGVGVEEALEMIRAVRPVIEPSRTFREQLEVYHYARCRVSRKDKETRRWYLERTAMEVMHEGEYDPEATGHMAKFPSTPTPSQPSTPMTGYARRKIRCKMCRRQLATREHMMDHILDQTPLVPRSRTPSMSFPNLPSPLSTMDGPPLEISSTAGDSAERKRRNSRLGSMSSQNGSSPLGGAGVGSMTMTMDEGDKEVQRENSATGKRVLDAETLAASLPPQLAALRAGVPGRHPPQQPTAASNAARRMTQPVLPGARASDSPTSSNNVSPRHSFSNGQTASSPGGQADGGADATTPLNRNQAARKLSMMALTPSSNGNALGRISMDESAIASDGEQAGSPIEGASLRRRGSASSFTAQRDPPILSHDSKCSGYFVEPLTWMEPFLENGNMAGKILCPNEKCKAKIGNYDWAGVQCGCKDWVVPGFCIARNKVDEVW